MRAGSGNDAFSYDAENHTATVSDSYTCTYTNALNNTSGSCTAHADNATSTLGWGPDAHLRTLNTIYSGGASTPAPYNLAMHFDGDAPLYTSDSLNGVVLYIGELGFVQLGKLTVLDRDQSGQLQAVHTSSAFSSWNVVKPYEIYTPSYPQKNGDLYYTNYAELVPGSAGACTSGCNTTNGTPPQEFDGLYTSPLNLQRGDGFGFTNSDPRSLAALSFLT